MTEQSTMIFAQHAAQWIATNRPDVAIGVEPKILLVADDDVFSLPELEDYGRAGNAVKLCEEPFGELWWCDPEERETVLHECLLYAVNRRTAVLRFYQH